MSGRAIVLCLALACILGGPAAQAANQAPLDGPVSGFASNVPLELAIYQIIPPQIAAEISPAVDRKLKVSWRGGPSWRRSLAAMLTPLGLAAVEGAPGVLLIGPAGQAANPPPPPADRAAAEPRTSRCARAGEEDPRPIGRWRVWTARQGSDLQSALVSWVDAIKLDLGDPELFELAWHARGLRYPLKATIRCEGYFSDAVLYLLSAWADVPARPIGTLYTNALAISAVGGSDVPVDE
jgi:hypothetical protein